MIRHVRRLDNWAFVTALCMTIVVSTSYIGSAMEQFSNMQYNIDRLTKELEVLRCER